ncbi:type II secretion system protein GspL [Photobacterium sp.]|uniref:type II secretion system protein GspL n=1 Tax=Photobacterium sp. TaxID=660 RepID=UPI00299D54C8|nr:type II secretion system protein GspL [Photobacterium sp.]MDX1303983.1 type II secretion system protein GspL [Photobacterium sp.]
MSEFLTIRLSSRPEQPVQWLVWSPQQNEVIASGQLADMTQLNELAEYAAQRPVIALVPASELLLTQVAIPAGSGRQLAAVLPYLLEEELAQDVDSLHVHLIKRQGDIANVAIIEHSKIEHWLNEFVKADIEVKKLVPDCLCLPLYDDGYSAAELGRQWLVRQSEALGVCAEPSWLGSWLLAQKAPIATVVVESEEPETEEEPEAETADGLPVLTIHHFTPAPEHMPGNWQPETPELVMQLLAEGAESSKVNLLSGPYKPQSVWRKHLKPWRKVAIAAGLVLTTVVVEHFVSVQRMELQAQAYRAESERIFRQVLPEFKRIPSQSYLKNQMNSAITRLGGDGSDQGLLPWLLQLKPMLSNVPQMTILNMKYDQNRGELRLQASAAEFQHFEQLRTLLAKDFEVEQGQLNKDGNQVNGAVVLRRKS